MSRQIAWNIWERLASGSPAKKQPVALRTFLKGCWLIFIHHGSPTFEANISWVERCHQFSILPSQPASPQILPSRELRDPCYSCYSYINLPPCHPNQHLPQIVPSLELPKRSLPLSACFVGVGTFSELFCHQYMKHLVNNLPQACRTFIDRMMAQSLGSLEWQKGTGKL